MKTTLLPAPASSPSCTPAAPPPPRAAGRPSAFNAQVVDGLCAMIRESGLSDSGAASRMNLHPSTVSRWKRECPDFALLLRTAREEFRTTQLGMILSVAQSSKGWRAAAWLLERVFPQDYSPRAAERAKFQEMYEAQCAQEEEAGAEMRADEMIEQPNRQTTGESARYRGEALQNVKNAGGGLEKDAAELMHAAFHETRQPALLPSRPLQNVKNSPLAGTVCPPGVKLKGSPTPSSLR